MASANRLDAVVTEEPALYVATPVLKFSETDDDLPGRDGFLRALRKKADTELLPIHKEDDLLMSSHGVLQGKYRLTWDALRDISWVMIKGGLSGILWGLLNEGDKSDPDQHREAVEVASDVFNRIMMFRFKELHGRRLVVDHRNKLIEGMVSQNYSFIANADLYQRIEGLVEQSGAEVEFYEGLLAGGRIQFRYKNRSRSFALSTPLDKLEPFYGGWHFVSSEVGHACISGTHLLHRAWSKSSAMAPYKAKHKISHAVKDISDSKLFSVVKSVGKDVERVKRLKPALESLKKHRLGFDGESDLRGQHKKLAKLLRNSMRALLYRRQPPKLSSDIVDRAIFHGSYRVDVIPERGLGPPHLIDPDLLQAVTKRTAYDLFSALIVSARGLPPEAQEAVEQTAYKVLANGKKFFEE